ncbi:MAG: GrpB family protein [Burkholderiaceae bacterium]|nr:GrpB family protein [Burkholderiaceae bacterium]
MRTSDAGSDAPVEVVPYDSSWPHRFLEEQALLAEILSPWLVAPVEHVGSTAVPGLLAKPIIDIAAPVASLEASRPAIEALRRLGYQHFPYKPEQMHWFCKPAPALRTHHLHLLPYGGVLWSERLAFRNALRANAELAAQYAELKLRLAALHRADREAYTDAKSEFILAALGVR